MMKQNDETKILGALLLSLGQSCINYKFLVAGESDLLGPIRADEWYPLEKLSAILNFVQVKYADPAPILEQIGIGMMDLWYAQGPGEELIQRGVDFLHFQTGSSGYYSVIQGPPGHIGDFSLLSLDEEEGTAVVHSTTPFNRDMERGVLKRGMRAKNDLIYIHVDNSEDEDIFNIRFIDSARARKRPADIPDEIDLNTLYWKHRMLGEEFSRHSRFWNTTNHTLSRAFEKMGRQGQALQERTSELVTATSKLHQEITVRKRAETALRESEAELRALFAGMPDVVIMLDRGGHYLKIAPTQPGLLYRPEEELQGKSLHETFPPKQADLFLKQVHLSFDSQQVVRFEYSLDIGPDRREFEGRVAPMSDQAVVFVARDITERKRAEETLRKSEEKHRVIFENANDMIIIAQDGKIAFANPALTDVLGYPVTEIVSKPFTEFIHPDDRAMVFERYRRRMAGEEVKTGYQFRVVTASGDLRWVNINSSAMDWDGKPSTLNFLTDITEQKLAQDAVRRSEAQLRSILEASPYAIGVGDLKGRIVNCNRQMLIDHGVSAKDELLGSPSIRLVARGERRRARAFLEEALKRGETATAEFTFVRRNREEFPCELSVNVICDASGKVTGFVAVSRDITRQKEEEKELRNAKILADKARREAESANRAKSAFLANMSHELRTPLNSILGYTQILKRDNHLKRRQNDAVGTIYNSGVHLLNLINELLDLSRIEARKMELEPGDVHLPGFVREITEIAGIRAQQEGVPFDCDMASNLPNGVRVDEKRLRQVLLNLINNAIKFAGNGRVVFSVRAEPPGASRAMSPVTRLHCEVRDTGIGISPEEIEKIFLPFHQVNKTTPTTEGTGLGLPISRNLLHIMGSELHVRSTEGKGTTFWFVLDVPVVEGVTARKPGGSLERARRIVGYEGEKRTILIADDNDNNRTILREMLSPLGFAVEEAVNGRDAYEKAKRVSPDCILMDLVMPDMDGLEATKRIRRAALLKEIPVIGVSASVLDSKREVSLEAGCNDFLPKPIHFDNLLELLQHHIHLQWRYEKKSPVDSAGQSEQAARLVVPPKRELRSLLKYAGVNHITGIRQSLDAMKGDRRYTPFVTEIDELVEDFKFSQIVERLEAYLSEGIS